MAFSTILCNSPLSITFGIVARYKIMSPNIRIFNIYQVLIRHDQYWNLNKPHPGISREWPKNRIGIEIFGFHQKLAIENAYI